ncbi:hypothetical protein PSHT_13615 [Puccinia striiformis]|uniref:Uncharacterized protein n=1 Tax=Puccinia striiformis TaxID=27350 RepID=A0A2S4UPI3_9BASI|nr:hypothetical protein PSHT_13615 [Puccinia striiformis]
MSNPVDIINHKSDIYQPLETATNERMEQPKDLGVKTGSLSHHADQQQPIKDSLLIEKVTKDATTSQQSESSYESTLAPDGNLLRHMIAINLEFEFKRQLCPSLPACSPVFQSRSMFKSVMEAKKNNPEHAARIQQEWYPTDLDAHQFFTALELLKSFPVHPTNTIEGQLMTVSTTLALLQQDFDPHMYSRAIKMGYRWDASKKQFISRLVTKLAREEGSDSDASQPPWPRYEAYNTVGTTVMN